ncbi:DUF4811 domain-containing protein [Lentilactobacillus kisonensis]|uniref:DUF4811 domain-containing protein n=1 Tax=Lentilactobacillus kisonensis TaxID=481722 RepID=UPI002436DB51|nr:DUF4811 domain-containing protein [Lentilactobacillus kisonensis]
MTRGQTHETAYVYKDKNGNRESFLDKHHAVRVVQTNQRQAYKRRQQQQYHYRNQFLRWLFYGGTNEGEVKHQTITFMVNQDWTEVTPSQITKVKHQLRSAEERQKNEASGY